MGRRLATSLAISLALHLGALGAYLYEPTPDEPVRKPPRRSGPAARTSPGGTSSHPSTAAQPKRMSIVLSGRGALPEPGRARVELPKLTEEKPPDQKPPEQKPEPPKPPEKKPEPPPARKPEPPPPEKKPEPPKPPEKKPEPPPERKPEPPPEKKPEPPPPEVKPPPREPPPDHRTARVSERPLRTPPVPELPPPEPPPEVKPPPREPPPDARTPLRTPPLAEPPPPPRNIPNPQEKPRAPPPPRPPPDAPKPFDAKTLRQLLSKAASVAPAPAEEPPPPPPKVERPPPRPAPVVATAPIIRLHEEHERPKDHVHQGHRGGGLYEAEPSAAAGRAGEGAPVKLDPLEVIRERIRTVAKIAHPSKGRGRHGTAVVRFRMNPGGYALEMQVLRSTGHGVLDAELPAVLHLAEPYPYVDGWVVVTVPF